MLALLAVHCVPPPRMCAQEADCGSQASCVAGRCVARGATPAIDSARRLLFAPVDVGYVRGSGDGRDGADGRDSAVATLGRAGTPAVAFLRFEVRLPPEATVLEAYVLLERATDVDADPVPVPLHAARIVTAWDGRSLSWARQPHLEEVGAPVTRVMPGAGPFVRLDVRELVQRWRRRERDDLGVAVLADDETPTGVALALAPSDSARDRDDPVLGAHQGPAPAQSPSLFEPRVAVTSAAEPRRQHVGPRLELYVK